MRPLAEHHSQQRGSQSPCSGRKQSSSCNMDPHICGTAQCCCWSDHLQRRHARLITRQHCLQAPRHYCWCIPRLSLCPPHVGLDSTTPWRRRRHAKHQAIGASSMQPCDFSPSLVHHGSCMSAPHPMRRMSQTHHVAPCRLKSLGIVRMQHCSMKGCRLYALVFVLNGPGIFCFCVFILSSWFF